MKKKGRLLMKNSVKLLLILFCFAVWLISADGCKQETQPTVPSTYVYTPQGQTTAPTGETETPEANKSLHIDTSWQDSYDVTYKYYHKEDGGDEVSVTEKRAMNAFSVEYLNQGDILYYVANGSNIDYYVLVPGQTQQMHSVVKNSSLKDLSSTFMKLTAVSAELPSLVNVVYVGQESVAGRPADKYIQRAYKNSTATETVYLWIDREFGFASKCEAYDAANRLTTSWEVLKFTAGGIKDTDVQIDLSAYTFREE